MFSKRHYEAIARIIRDNRELFAGADEGEARCAIGNVQAALRNLFIQDNPRFNVKRFETACAPEVQSC